MLGLPLGSPCELRRVRRLGFGLFPLELLTTATQPLKPRAPVRKRRGELVAAGLTELLVLDRVGFRGLLEDRVDLLRIAA